MAEKVTLVCGECGKTRKVSADGDYNDRCPKCGGVDWDVVLSNVEKRELAEIVKHYATLPERKQMSDVQGKPKPEPAPPQEPKPSPDDANPGGQPGGGH